MVQVAAVALMALVQRLVPAQVVKATAVERPILRVVPVAVAAALAVQGAQVLETRAAPQAMVFPTASPALRPSTQQEALVRALQLVVLPALPEVLQSTVTPRRAQGPAVVAAVATAVMATG